MTREHPILFSAPMVKAILAGAKSQTRRAVKPPRTKHRLWRMDDNVTVDPGGTWLWGPGPYLKVPFCHVNDGWEADPEQDTRDRVYCPYGYPEDGARLWVRERHRFALCPQPDGLSATYAATPDETRWFPHRPHGPLMLNAWRPSIHMPRWASRLTLEVCGVRAERLQEISEEDARAEGVPGFETRASGRYPGRQLFRELWDGLNAKRGYGWDTNPFVWVIAFRVLPAPPHEEAL